MLHISYAWSISPTATPYVPFVGFLHLAQSSSVGLGLPPSTPAGVACAGGRKFCTRSRNILDDRLMSNTSNVKSRRLSISRNTVAILRQDGLHGMPANEAVATLRPPIFYKNKANFTTNVQKWSLKRIKLLLARLLKTEIESKKTGNPADLICGQLLAISTYTKKRVH